jgi:NADH-quinone oxidoreductase subunit L
VLVALAAGSVAAGWIGMPAPLRELLGVGAPFVAFVGRVLPETALRADVAHAAESFLMLGAVGVALAGIVLAWLRYGRGARDHAAEARARDPFYRAVSHGYYVDAFYERVVVRPLGWFSEAVLANRTEPLLARASLERPARAGAALARGFARLQTGDLQTYLVYALIGVALVLVLGAARG